jgi:hypothetical protein
MQNVLTLRQQVEAGMFRKSMTCRVCGANYTRMMIDDPEVCGIACLQCRDGLGNSAVTPEDGAVGHGCAGR